MLPTATIASCYKQFAELPTITSGRLIPHNISRYDHDHDKSTTPPSNAIFADIITSQQDLTNTSTIKSTQTYSLQSTTHHPHTFPSEIPSRYKLTSISPTGRRRAIVTSSTNKENNTTTLTTIEIFHNDKRIYVHNASSKHGDIHTSGPFAGMSWSKDETSIVYVAEKKTATKNALYPKTTTATTTTTTTNDQDTLGNDYEYQEHFGELCENYRTPEIYVLTVDTGDILFIDSFSKSQFPGRPVWLPSSTSEPERKSIVVTVWESFHGRRLGMIFYSSRKSFICKIEINDTNHYGEMIPMTTIEQDQSACDPRFASDGSKMVYMTSIATELHGSTMVLKMKTCQDSNWYNDAQSNHTSETIVDVPRGKELTTSFPGLYLQPGCTPERIFLGTGRYLIVTSKFKSSTALILIDTSKRNQQAVHIIEIPGSIATNGTHRAFNSSVLDVYGDKILFKFSTSHCPDSAFVLNFTDVTSDACSTSMTWCRVSLPSSPIDRMLTTHVKNICTKVYDVVADNGETFEAVLIQPGTGSTGDSDGDGDKNEDKNTTHTNSRSTKLSSLILYPHGGPHSQSFIGYTSEMSLLTLMGFSVLHVNYRGSLGFGQDLLESLPGNIGKNDVDDCMSALDIVLKDAKNVSVDADSIYVMGGSHGGFLTTHLIAQYPNRFIAASVRNPVVNVWANYITCDIPDWCHSECGTGVRIGMLEQKGGAKMDSFLPSNQEHAVQMLKMSPISNIDSVVTPVLLLLGTKDKRVPMGQSMQYYYGLKAKGVECKMNIYEMSHSLSDNVTQRANVWVSVCKWMLNHSK